MKRNLKKAASLLLAAVLLLTPLTALCAGAADMNTAQAFLHTEGENIVNGAGEQVVLRGTNFGGWGIMEDWFCPFTDPAGEDNAYLTLVSRFGA